MYSVPTRNKLPIDRLDPGSGTILLALTRFWPPGAALLLLLRASTRAKQARQVETAVFYLASRSPLPPNPLHRWPHSGLRDNPDWHWSGLSKRLHGPQRYRLKDNTHYFAMQWWIYKKKRRAIRNINYHSSTDISQGYSAFWSVMSITSCSIRV